MRTRRGGAECPGCSAGDVYHLKPLGDAAPVIDAGGIFEYARRTGMIANMKNEAAAA